MVSASSWWEYRIGRASVKQYMDIDSYIRMNTLFAYSMTLCRWSLDASRCFLHVERVIHMVKFWKLTGTPCQNVVILLPYYHDYSKSILSCSKMSFVSQNIDVELKNVYSCNSSPFFYAPNFLPQDPPSPIAVTKRYAASAPIGLCKWCHGSTCSDLLKLFPGRP